MNESQQRLRKNKGMRDGIHHGHEHMSSTNMSNKKTIFIYNGV
ncbi:hypothetical protein [Turicimonas muris]|nr:hypothetical protein [Turicimonas muris]